VLLDLTYVIVIGIDMNVETCKRIESIVEERLIL
jgi:hypothetical protein